MDKENIMRTIIEYCDSIPYSVGKFGIAQHPLFNSFGTVDCVTRELVVISPDNIDRLKQQRYDQIRKCFEMKDGLFGFFLQFHKPYRIPILMIIKDSISKKQFSQSLAELWMDTEFPHQNGVSVMVNLFELADKKDLMSSKEKIFLMKLPKEITVYRGLQRGAKLRGLSWTLNKDKAKWFAKRFDRQGKVYSAKIEKRKVFAYFNGREEEEIVLNPNYLKRMGEHKDGKI